MNIGIDANVLTIPHPCGVKIYGEMLIKGLSKIDSENSYFLFSAKKISIPKKKNFKSIILPNSPILKRQIILPLYVGKYKIDVFHYLEPYGSIFLKHKKIITTVHDLDLNLNYPLVSKYFITRIMNEITRHFTFKNTTLFLLPTGTIQKELYGNRRFGSKGKDFSIIAEGVMPQFSKKRRPQKKMNTYILGMGDFSPRKNVKKLIESYSSLDESTKNKHHLIIVASTGEVSKKYKQHMHSYRLGSSANVITKPTTNKLHKLYHGALFFVYPSLYEGFGLPILEAMACGCPVITSNYGAMKEVAGGATHLVNPNSSDDISASMLHLIKDKELRDTLVRKGLKRAKEFSWEKTAKMTLKAYQKMQKS